MHAAADSNAPRMVVGCRGRSVYLDDHTSFTEISGNVFVDASAYHSAISPAHASTL